MVGALEMKEMIDQSPLSWAPLRERVSQADGRLHHWMNTLQISLELVYINKILTTPGPWRLVASNRGRDVVIDPIPPFLSHVHIIWRLRVRVPKVAEVGP